MADYVSKYTGSEVDGILDEAIELPQYTNEDIGKFLKYGDNGLVWGLPFPRFTSNDEGQVLKVVAASEDEIYLGWEDPINITNAHNGEFLKYSSTTGIMWDSIPNGSSIDTTYAHNGEFLKYSSTTGVMWADPPTDSFGYLADHGWNGALLSCVDNSPSWVNVRSALSDIIPTYDTHNNSSDAGKILTVLNNGSLGWVLSNQ